VDDFDSEGQLIARAIEGDGQALEELLFAHYDRLGRRIARRLPAALRGVFSEEDILQEAMTAAFRGIGTFQPRGRWSFYRWQCAIADNALRNAISYHNAAKRGGGRTAAGTLAPPYDSCDDLIDMLAGPGRTPSRSVARHEAANAVQMGLASLKPDYRQAITLRYVQGLPVAEVATVMNRTPRAVHNLCRRGLRELHGVLGRSSDYLTRK